MSDKVAVIDIGSNSIKALVAEQGTGPFDLNVLYDNTLEVRISQGIGGEPPMLRADRIEAGVEAVQQLWEASEEVGPLKAIRIVATSAVRSAGNGHVFIEAVEKLTGIRPSILSGDEEADAIAMGIRTDPGIDDHMSQFTAFDLGGGSLEIIRFVNNEVRKRTSLPLGAVRLTERFIKDPSGPVPKEEVDALLAHVRREILSSGVPVKKPLVGCSGGLAALRRIQAGKAAGRLMDSAAYIDRRFIEEFAGKVCRMSLADRLVIPGMPARRADIFPAAMCVFREILRISEADGLLHSFHNLRYGLCLRLLRGDSG